jgi:hypothetical protein
MIWRQARYLHNRPDFDRTCARPWNPSGYAERVVEILRIDQEVPAELLASLRKRAIRYEALAVTHLNAGRRRGRMQRSGGQVLPFRVEVSRELRGFLVTLLSLGLVQKFLVKVNQQHVFHVCSSIVESNDRRRIDGVSDMPGRRVLDGSQLRDCPIFPGDSPEDACLAGVVGLMERDYSQKRADSLIRVATGRKWRWRAQTL